MAAEKEFPKSDGDVLFASEVNHFNNKLIEIYTASAFDSSQAGNGTTSNNHELTAVTDTFDSDNIKVSITGSSIRSVAGGSSGSGVTLTVEIKEIGGSYGTVLSTQVDEINGVGLLSEKAYTFVAVATLTAGMKSNGFQIRVTSATNSSASNTHSFSNIQTVEEFI